MIFATVVDRKCTVAETQTCGSKTRGRSVCVMRDEFVCLIWLKKNENKCSLFIHSGGIKMH